MILYVILLVLHITFAAVLFGGSLGLVGNLRRALASGPEALRHAAEDAKRRDAIAGISAMLTLLTGFALVFERGGFAVLSTNFHIAITLMIVAIVFAFAWMKPSTARLVKAVGQDPIDTAGAEQAVKKLAMGSGILHAAWLVLLVLMVYRF
ncbi:MAG: hypothetical protein GKR89_09675 [Candidatus Latescibacteria bacterium]|nr:hypothetical protein [Candidatus Latescibacterota bacterium]